LTKDKTLSHLELDNRNSSACAAINFWDCVMNKFNDESYKPFSYELRGWGALFETSHDLSWTKLHALGIQKFTDKAQVKEHFRQINNELGYIIKDWTASGSGDNTYGKDLENKDKLTADEVVRLPMIGADHPNFVHNQNPMTMYLWFILLLNGLYQTALTELHTDSQAEGSKVPSVLRCVGGSIATHANEIDGIHDMILFQGNEIIKTINRGFDQHALSAEIYRLMMQLSQLKDQHSMIGQLIYDMKRDQITFTMTNSMRGDELVASGMCAYDQMIKEQEEKRKVVADEISEVKHKISDAEHRMNELCRIRDGGHDSSYDSTPKVTASASKSRHRNKRTNGSGRYVRRRLSTEEENNATSVDVEEAHVEDTDEEEQNKWETE